ncbi:MAG: ATP synthase F1 subunit epsilon [Ruminococcaceae bacterium]|nr:ATP synthase F1 subunit epsilon [Oscillospiraceae bacterium]
MNEFELEIVTPDGLLFEGNARKIILRTVEGDVGILPRHSDYVAPLAIGVARVFTQSGERSAACAGGMVSVMNGVVRVVASTFEWSEDIDVERALKAKEKAQTRLEESKRSDYEHRLAEIKLKKSLARLSASERK